MSRRVPHNYILLTIFTLAQAYSGAQLASSFTVATVVQCMFLTAVMLSTIAVYALLTKTDFTTKWAVIHSYGVSLLTYMALSLFWELRMSVFFSLIGIMLASVYLIFDIQLICLGKHSSIKPDDYILGAITLYLDVLLVFTALLKICKCCKK